MRLSVCGRSSSTPARSTHVGPLHRAGGGRGRTCGLGGPSWAEHLLELTEARIGLLWCWTVDLLRGCIISEHSMTIFVTPRWLRHTMNLALELGFGEGMMDLANRIGAWPTTSMVLMRSRSLKSKKTSGIKGESTPSSKKTSGIKGGKYSVKYLGLSKVRKLVV